METKKIKETKQIDNIVDLDGEEYEDSCPECGEPLSVCDSDCFKPKEEEVRKDSQGVEYIDTSEKEEDDGARMYPEGE